MRLPSMVMSSERLKPETSDHVQASRLIISLTSVGGLDDTDIGPSCTYETTGYCLVAGACSPAATRGEVGVVD